jgi:hypothetical protein
METEPGLYDALDVPLRPAVGKLGKPARLGTLGTLGRN